MKAVQFSRYGGTAVLETVRLPTPKPGPGQLLVRVVATGVNPVDFLVRRGLRQEIFRITFPSGTGSDFAGVVDAVGAEVADIRPGDEVFGSTAFAALAEYVLVDRSQVAAKPGALPWSVAGSLAVAGSTAYDALASQSVTAADTALVSAANGGVGVILAQLARRTGATVIGTASTRNHPFLHSVGIIPVAYGEGGVDRIRNAAGSGITVAFDQWGDETIEQAIELGVPRERINTVATDPTKYGVRRVGRQGMHPQTLALLADLVVTGGLVLPEPEVFPFEEYRSAIARAETRHAPARVVIQGGSL
ncbi:NADP-dependent oxidoreductase [Leifsonia sp. NPDC058194]|uniref:NADP-dependent oxidoreductase n=1 Tax=Leifsonia sp. NPDC058194 TaxID=3346374 RepID=UPI0036D803C3